MRFSQSSFVYFDYSLQEAIRRLHRFGYEGIEVWGGRPHAYRGDLDGQLDEIRTLLQQCGMTVPNFVPAQFRYPSILCSCNETVREDSVGYIRHAIDNAVELGAPHVSVCPGKTLHGEDVREGWRQLRRSLKDLAAYAADRDLILLIEPAHRFESNLILTVPDGIRMIEEVGSDRLGILLDTGHASVNGEDLTQTVLSLRGLPLHIHIDDNDGTSDAHLVPGDGQIDFAPFARALEEIGYTGFVSAELGFGYTVDPDPAVERTLTWLREAFAPERGRN
jgi:protein FrlC